MKKSKPAAQPVAAAAPPAPKSPTHICPKCKTAVCPPDDTLAVIVPGYQAYHCLKCWGEILRAAVPALTLIAPGAPAPAAAP